MRRYGLLAIIITIAVLRVVVQQVSPQVVTDLSGGSSESVKIFGKIVEDPDYRDRVTKLVLQPQAVFERGLYSKILVDAPRVGEYSKYDRVFVEGSITKPRSFRSDNGSVFDYVGYLDKDDIHYLIKHPNYVRVVRGGDHTLSAYLSRAKSIFTDSIKEALREPHASFALGILIGGKSALGDELINAFHKTGLVHMIVLSGYNVSIIVSFVIALIPNLGRMIKLSAGILAVVLFAIFVGGGATVIRASIMAICGLGANFFGARYSPIKSLFLAAALMVIYNPKIFMNDPSFHLSFLATLSLIMFSPLVDAVIHRLKIFGRSWIASAISTTVAAQILTAPYIAHSMRTLPLLGVLANVLVTPITPLLMLAVFVLGITNMAFGAESYLVVLLSTLSQVAISYVFEVVNSISSLPYSSVELGEYPMSFVFMTYVVIAAVYLLLSWLFESDTKLESNNYDSAS